MDNTFVPKEIDKILVTEQEISETIQQLAEIIEADYYGRVVKMICNLQGAMYFYTRLLTQIRLINIERVKENGAEHWLTIVQDAFSTSKYGNGSQDVREPRIRFDLYYPIRGEDVILVEDLLDTLDTMKFIIGYFSMKQPKSLRICSLFRKIHTPIDSIDNVAYVGKIIPDEWVVGMGLDGNASCNGKMIPGSFRELPYVGVLKKEFQQ